MLTRNESHRVFIHTLTDHSLLNIFYHCQPIPLDEDESDDGVLWRGEQVRESCQWWYTLAHVCQKWRFLVLSSPSLLGLSLVCSYGTPITDMLTHSPPLPLVIDYADEDRTITKEDEGGILLALQHHHQVRHIRLCIPVSNLQKVIEAIDGEFPMLEYICIEPLANDDESIILPETFRAPHIRRLVLKNVTHSPIMVMHHPPPPTPCVQSTEGNNLGEPCAGPLLLRNRPLKTFIHVLDDDSLLNIFYYCRPVLLDEAHADELDIFQGGAWDRESWWYKFVQVCRRWRYLIFGSAFHLGVSLRCTYGAPIADMLEDSPLLPLVIDYIDEDRDLSEEDENGIMLAFQHRDRVRRIRLLFPYQPEDSQKFVLAMGAKFPMLEFLYLDPLMDNGNTGFSLPETFRAPHLRHLVLSCFAFPMVFPSLAPAKGLITLSLDDIPESAYYSPNSLLQWVSLMPQLQTLEISFASLPNPDVERQDLDMPMMTRVTLPNLRWFGFEGASTYLEALLPQVLTPPLEKLDVYFFDQRIIYLANLKQFIRSAGNFRSTGASLLFDNDHRVVLNVYPREGTIMPALSVSVGRQRPVHNRQVFLAAQMCGVLGPLSSTVVDLHLFYVGSELLTRLYNQATRIQWREVLKTFNNVKTLRLHKALLWYLSLSLQVYNEESPMEVLPELKEIRCNASEDDVPDAFDAFLEARENAGFPVMLFYNA